MPAPYCYPYPHPAVTTDVALFGLRDGDLHILLIRRAHPPFAGYWALPGGFLEIDEELEDGARRELREETGIEGVFLEQLHTFGAVGRDPRERVISVVYLGLGHMDQLTPTASDDAAEAAWFPHETLPPLAFDHDRVIDLAHRHLASHIHQSPCGLRLLPEAFTLDQARELYQAIWGETLEPDHFQRWILSFEAIEPSSERPGHYCLRTPEARHDFR